MFLKLFSPRVGTSEIIVHIPRNPCLWKRKKKKEKFIKRRLLAHWDYSNISNCRTKILEIFRGIFIIFCGVSKYLRIYSTISRGNPEDGMWNPVWETLQRIEEPRHLQQSSFSTGRSSNPGVAKHQTTNKRQSSHSVLGFNEDIATGYGHKRWEHNYGHKRWEHNYGHKQWEHNYVRLNGKLRDEYVNGVTTYWNVPGDRDWNQKQSFNNRWFGWELNPIPPKVTATTAGTVAIRACGSLS